MHQLGAVLSQQFGGGQGWVGVQNLSEELLDLCYLLSVVGKAEGKRSEVGKEWTLPHYIFVLISHQLFFYKPFFIEIYFCN